MPCLLRALIGLVCCAVVPCSAQDAQGTPIVLQPGALRLAFERLRMPGGERPLSLAEVGLLADLPWSLYAGPALFGAVAGERGGFFVAGVEMGWRAEPRLGLGLDAGLFAGGGGGGSAPVGGGLMLRPRLALTWSTQQDRFSLGIARATFPSGEIRSAQVYVAWERRLHALFSHEPLEPWEALRHRGNLRLWPVALDVMVSHRSQVGDLHGAGATVPAMDLVGLSTGFGIAGPLRLRVEGHAAYGGDSGGYMEALAGPELRFELGPGRRLALVGALEAGSGGGGGIATGGGFLVKASGGLDLSLVSSFHAGLEAGIVAAPSAPLRAASIGMKLGWAFELAGAGGATEEAAAPSVSAELFALSWRFRSSLRRYASAQRVTAGGGSVPVDELAFHADLLVSDATYVTAQSGWAVSGQAGAWATGLLGGGLSSPSWRGHRVGMEALAGAGGGGGIWTGGGALVHATAWWSYDLTARVGIQLSAGRARAIGGRFDSNLVDAGLVFRGSSLARSPWAGGAGG